MSNHRYSDDQGTVGGWRSKGLHSLDASCGPCGRHAVVKFAASWPDGLPIRALRRRLVCQCGARDPGVMPAWRFMADAPTAWTSDQL